MGKLLKAIGWIAVLLVVGCGALLFAFWVPDVPVAELKAKWAPPPSQFMPIAGMDVHLRDEGPREDPEPIVLLHGTSASLHTWEGWVSALKTQRRVIRLDLPGFGLTGPDPRSDYSFDAYARFMLAVLDTLKVERCVIAGNSFGGAVAIATTLAAPDRVSRLVLVDSGGYPMNSTSVPIGFRIAAIPGARLLIGKVLPRRVIERSLESVYGDPSKVTPGLVDLYFDITRREGNRDALLARRAPAPSDGLAGRIKDVKVPTLILWGGRDRLISPANAQRFKTDLAASEVALFDGLGHVPMEEDPVATVAAVTSFLAKPADRVGR